MVQFNVNDINLCTEYEGPNKRVAIWFQGCNICCEGCCNPELQPLIIKNILSLEKLIEIIKESQANFEVEGVTFLGGEPTLQLGLGKLAEEIQNIGMGVILFTGKNLEELEDRLVKFCDIIVDEPFNIKEIETERNLVGSKNQRIHYITNRYKNMKNWFDIKREKVVKIDVGENIIITGDVID